MPTSPSRAPRNPTRSARRQHQEELKQIGAKPAEDWLPGNAPSLAMTWAVSALAKAGTLSIIGVYPQTMMSFPIGQAMNKNLTLKMGNCNHRKYIPGLIELVRNGTIDPLQVLTKREPLTGVIDAYKNFTEHKPGWVKVELKLSALTTLLAGDWPKGG